MKDSLGDRMKRQYESRSDYYLPRRSFTIMRLDGVAFHTYTKSCERPYDEYLRKAMVVTTQKLCTEIQGAVFGYTQSDEISILLQDFKNINTDAWFDGRIQKMTSVSAAIASAAFNRERVFQKAVYGTTHGKDVYFDSRVFTIPDRVEVMNYFIWRQKDASRNSLSMLAQHHFSHKQLMGKCQEDMHNMLHEIGVNWNDEHTYNKRGTLILQEPNWTGVPPQVWTTEGELDKLVPNYPHTDKENE